MKNSILPYNPNLKEVAKKLRNNSTLSEVLLWNEIKHKKLGVEFHRQVPGLSFVMDFYCHEIQLAIEIDGSTHQGEVLIKDEYRQKLLEEQGVRFIRFTDMDVKTNLSGVMQMLEERIKELQCGK